MRIPLLMSHFIFCSLLLTYPVRSWHLGIVHLMTTVRSCHIHFQLSFITFSRTYGNFLCVCHQQCFICVSYSAKIPTDDKKKILGGFNLPYDNRVVVVKLIYREQTYVSQAYFYFCVQSQFISVRLQVCCLQFNILTKFSLCLNFEKVFVYQLHHVCIFLQT